MMSTKRPSLTCEAPRTPINECSYRATSQSSAMNLVNEADAVC